VHAGTGKTNTIVAIVSALLGTKAAEVSGTKRVDKPARILVCAQSNAAVDELAVRLSHGIFDSASGNRR